MSILTLPLPWSQIDAGAFEQAVDHLAGAVAVIAWGGQSPSGLLVHTVSVLSAKPPRILFAVDKQDGGHGDLLLQQACGVSLLCADDQPEAERFSGGGPTQDRFRPDRWILSPDAPPRFIGSLAHFSGYLDQKIDAGSHSLFIVRVCAVEVRQSAPLVYFDHAFRQLQTLADIDPGRLDRPTTPLAEKG